MPQTFPRAASRFRVRQPVSFQTRRLPRSIADCVKYTAALDDSDQAAFFATQEGERAKDSVEFRDSQLKLSEAAETNVLIEEKSDGGACLDNVLTLVALCM